MFYRSKAKKDSKSLSSTRKSLIDMVMNKLSPRDQDGKLHEVINEESSDEENNIENLFMKAAQQIEDPEPNQLIVSLQPVTKNSSLPRMKKLSSVNLDS